MEIEKEQGRVQDCYRGHKDTYQLLFSQDCFPTKSIIM